jgi:integrase
MRCRSIPLAERVFFGFLNREGCRAGEAPAVTWGDFDLRRGAVRLDETKTDDPRTWALAPGVVEALKKIRPHNAQRARERARVSPTT